MGKKHKPAVKWMKEVWNVPQDVTELEDIVNNKRKYSAKQMYMLKVLQGNTKLLKQLADKLLPDKIDVTTGGGPLRTVVVSKMEEDED